jgi:hypothetical protein
VSAQACSIGQVKPTLEDWMRPQFFAAALLLAATPAFAQINESTTTRTTTSAETDCNALPTAAERAACVARGTSGSSSSVTTGDEQSSAEIKQRSVTRKETPFGSEIDSKTKSSATVDGPDGTAQKETTTSTHTER